MTLSTNSSTVGRTLVGCGLLATGSAALAAAPVVDVTVGLINEVPVGSPTEALLQDWGEGSIYDYDCNGVVDTADFLVMIAGDPDNATFMGLMLDWGEGSEYDLNCDGVVDTIDLLQQLQDLSQINVEDATQALFNDWGQGSIYDYDCSGLVDTADWLVLMSQEHFDIQEFLGLMSDYGTGSVWDLNCDGTVNSADYLSLLGEMANIASEAVGNAG